MAVSVYAAEPEAEILPEAPPLAESSTQAGEVAAPTLFGSLSQRQLLMVGLRLDAAYQGGGMVTQGFSLPSVRLTAWGDAGNSISYRFSAGQTREFSSALLPVLMPVEGYIDLHTESSLFSGRAAEFKLRLGLFTPSFVPWWTPDLSDVPLPDYHETHRRLFLSRDLGAELSVAWGKTVFYAGAFNGSGIFSLNTNNSRAFTAGARTQFSMGKVDWTWGVSFLFHEQADPASVNFKQDWMTDVYTSLEIPGTAWRLTAEAFGGQQNDSVQSTGPFGTAATLQAPLFRGVKLFTRAEFLNSQKSLLHGQGGLIVDLHPALTAYAFYQYLERFDGIENLGQLRLRLNL